MPFKLVTCPETAHLELIAYDDDPLGMLVHACSRFGPPRGLACSRVCAARLDARGRCERELYGSLDVGDDTGVIDLVGIEHRLQASRP